MNFQFNAIIYVFHCLMWSQFMKFSELSIIGKDTKHSKLKYINMIYLIDIFSSMHYNLLQTYNVGIHYKFTNICN